jgi:hypothetical protein
MAALAIHAKIIALVRIIPISNVLEVICIGMTPVEVSRVWLNIAVTDVLTEHALHQIIMEIAIITHIDFV